MEGITVGDMGGEQGWDWVDLKANSHSEGEPGWGSFTL